MNHLKKFKIFESNNVIESELEDILVDIKDSNPNDYWYYWIDRENYYGKDQNDYYEVYISFGDRDARPINHHVDDDLDEAEYRSVKISKSFIDTLRQCISYMEDLGFQYRLFIATEYSSDPDEDELDRYTLDDFDTIDYLFENQSVRIQFKK